MVEVDEEMLPGDEGAAVEPADANQKRECSSATAETRSFKVEEDERRRRWRADQIEGIVPRGIFDSGGNITDERIAVPFVRLGAPLDDETVSRMRPPASERALENVFDRQFVSCAVSRNVLRRERCLAPRFRRANDVAETVAQLTHAMCSRAAASILETISGTG
jgi:hypothetical protein